MAEIEIGIGKKTISNAEATVEFITTGEVVEYDSNDIYIDTTDTQVDSTPPCIEIEITGLKTYGTFIGLSDTPVYYENGKFFKVEDNKIIYTDITWADIQGEISENPVLEEQVKEIAKVYSEQFVKDTVNEAIDTHDKSSDAHQFIQDIITDNYTTLDNKINANIEELTDDIETLEINVDKNAYDINTLISEQAKTQENILELKQSVQDNNTLIQNTRQNLNELSDETKSSINEINKELTQYSNKIDNNTDNIERNYLLIANIINNLKEYAKKNSLSNVAFSGDYNDLINTPDIPSLDGYATTGYVDLKIDEAIGKISGFDFLVVDELPEIGESGHIYLVLHHHEDKDIYDEYIWVQSIQSFEKIGTTDIDLSDYYTKDEINLSLNTKVDKQNGYSLVSDAEIERLSNVYNYDDTDIKSEILTLTNIKQDKLTAGENISIVKDEESGNTTISAIDTVYTAGEGISIEGNVITNTNISAEWGNIKGDITQQADLQESLTQLNILLNTKIDTKQDILTAGDGIEIVDNTISGTTVVFRDWNN